MPTKPFEGEGSMSIKAFQPTFDSAAILLPQNHIAVKRS
jgi:hypothetical protein